MIALNTRKSRKFDSQTFLANIGEGREQLSFRKKQPIYTQGAPADSVFYIQKGKVKISVVSARGKEATIAILNSDTFFGEGALAGQPLRMGAASAFTDCELMRITKLAIENVLRSQPEFSEMFLSHILARNIRYEEDLVDQLFNSSEKRLARILLLLAHFGKDGAAQPVFANISQETLAEMVGTTRSRVSFFMNKFRKLGLIEYNDVLEVHSSLLNVVLFD